MREVELYTIQKHIVPSTNFNDMNIYKYDWEKIRQVQGEYEYIDTSVIKENIPIQRIVTYNGRDHYIAIEKELEDFLKIPYKSEVERLQYKLDKIRIEEENKLKLPLYKKLWNVIKYGKV